MCSRGEGGRGEYGSLRLPVGSGDPPAATLQEWADAVLSPEDLVAQVKEEVPPHAQGPPPHQIYIYN